MEAYILCPHQIGMINIEALLFGNVVLLYLMWTAWRERYKCTFNGMELSIMERKSLFEEVWNHSCTRYCRFHWLFFFFNVIIGYSNFLNKLSVHTLCTWGSLHFNKILLLPIKKKKAIPINWGFWGKWFNMVFELNILNLKWHMFQVVIFHLPLV